MQKKKSMDFENVRNHDMANKMFLPFSKTNKIWVENLNLKEKIANVYLKKLKNGNRL